MSANMCSHYQPNDAQSAFFDVEIDTNLYNIIIEWVRNCKKFPSRDDIIQNILNEYEDRYLRYGDKRDSATETIANPIFKHKIAYNRRYTSRQVYNELVFIYDTNRYHIRSLLNGGDCFPPGCMGPDAPCAACAPHPCGTINNVDEYIRNLIRTNYEQAYLGLNKTSILMSLPSYINRQEFEAKIKTICDCDATSYKLKSDLEIC